MYVMPRSKARFNASSALSGSLYDRNRLPPPMARIETRAPVRPRTRLGSSPFLPASAASASFAASVPRAEAPRNVRRDMRIDSSPHASLSQRPLRRNERLGETAQTLAHNGRARKQVPQLRRAEQTNIAQIMFDVVLPAIPARPFNQRPDGELSRDAPLPRGR